VGALDEGIEVFICCIRYVRAESCEGAAESCWEATDLIGF